MINRYDKKLREGNQLIIDLTPGNYVLRVELALELINIINDNNELKILEIGSGEGDLTKYILQKNKKIKIDCLDVSEKMIDSSKQLLTVYLDRINFIVDDALKYLKDIDFKYDIIISAWTIHNFKWQYKIKVLESIHTCLSENGKFLLMDKIYPDDKNEQKILLKKQINRFRYLDLELKKEIISHEDQDFLDDYRMDETKSLKIFKDIGFDGIQILDRVDRDILLLFDK
ncbi:MAG: class I SAM-dependent methyltransferase [Patescibacteria group bacterium]|jgi:phospholipid N-methyltransferase|nr:class I SAM-dependent methyltransferase [Patescibacteria group bacterium]